MAKDAMDKAKAATRGIPARLPATKVTPSNVRAKPRLVASALRMVCRLLAYKAELHLVRRRYLHLENPREHPATTRSVSDLRRTITYRRDRIVATRERAGSLRVVSTLAALIDELSIGSTDRMSGHRHPVSCRLEES